MTVKRGGLGRNLSALLGGVSPVHPLPDQPIQKLSTALLQPGKYQPRQSFDQVSLQELAQSIRQQGLLQPLVVRPIGENKYEILAGERRWRACQLASLTEVPVIVKTVSDEEAVVIALVENLQREDLTALESARAMDQLMKNHALTHQQVAALLSKSRSHVSNQLRLLGLPQTVQQHMERGELEMGHARALLMLDAPLSVEAARLVTEKKLSVRATEALVERLQKGEAVTQVVEPPPVIQRFEQRLIDRLSTKVEIKPGRSGKGKVVIHYDNEDWLDTLLTRLQ